MEIVQIVTRNSAIAYLFTVTVAPITPAVRGVPSEVVLNQDDGMKSSCGVNLHNTVTVPDKTEPFRIGREPFDNLRAGSGAAGEISQP